MTTETKPSTQPSARQELIKFIAKEAPTVHHLDLGNQEKASKALEVFLKGITEILKNKNILAFPGFGTFSVKDVPDRPGVNPRTGDKMQLKAYKKLTFKAGKNLKEALNPTTEIKKTAPKKSAGKK